MNQHEMVSLEIRPAHPEGRVPADRTAVARREIGRPRRVDPAAGEQVVAEVEFMQSMQAYKQASGRMFPTWSEVLEVLQSLGYQKPVV